MKHIALLFFVESSGTRFAQPEIKFLLEVAVTNPNIQPVDFILQECSTSLEGLAQFLVLEAVNGNTELVERLLVSDADLNLLIFNFHRITCTFTRLNMTSSVSLETYHGFIHM